MTDTAVVAEGLGKSFGRVTALDGVYPFLTGTPDELRARAGGDGLDLQAPPGQDRRRLAVAVAALGTAEAAVDEAAGRVVLPVTDGSVILPAVARPIIEATVWLVALLAVTIPIAAVRYRHATGS